MERSDTGCCGKSHPSQRLTEVSLLVLLSQGVRHGYAMLDQMKRFGIGSDQLDASTLYRNLRRMEASGVVQSAWEAGGPGPKRRVYRITSHGTQVLRQWIGFLENRRAQIDSLVEAYKTGASEDHPSK